VMRQPLMVCQSQCGESYDDKIPWKKRMSIRSMT
jgi:hypothetical protein